MKTYILLFFSLSFCISLSAQENQSPQSTAITDIGRYEIVQSEGSARYTFKVDKQDGRVYQMVKNDEGLYWQELLVMPHPLDTAKAGYVNYQLFVSGHGPRYTFLMNVNTGASWQLAKDPENEKIFWTPMDSKELRD